MSSAPKIVVLGSTSGQGRGVVSAILSHPSLTHYHVVGVTRDVDGSGAKALLDAHKSSGDRLHLISADIYDRKSLLKAFEGAYGVFGVTSDNLPGKLMETEDDLKHQLEAGKNIVAAAKEAAIEHFVFTSLPDVAKASGGKYTHVFHFDFKAQIEEMARKELKSVTALLPGLCCAMPSKSCGLIDMNRVLLRQQQLAVVLPSRRRDRAFLRPDVEGYGM
jgi:uncharacterized protein YbjT (DUF2867 family)